MYWVIVYDISNDLRRTHVAKFLENFGVRVQYSVFESRLNKNRLMKCINGISHLIDPRIDSVRFYSLCSSCWGKSLFIGKSRWMGLSDVVIW